MRWFLNPKRGETRLHSCDQCTRAAAVIRCFSTARSRAWARAVAVSKSKREAAFRVSGRTSSHKACLRRSPASYASLRSNHVAGLDRTKRQGQLG
jgi:hypothetical protein